MLETGVILDHTYEILEMIGRGGGGIVYKARHLRLNKLVAVKKVADNALGKLNVRGEADILKNLRHTYLPQVYDFLEVDGQIFTVMDYIPGHSLDYYLKRGTAFTVHQVVTWSRQLCEALSYLHRQRPPIIHRDIKPANVMITPEGNVCLIDFNISFGGAVENEVLAVSNGYSPPEQVLSFSQGYAAPAQEDAVVDEQSDIYSLGATIYHMATGVKPDKDWRKTPPVSAYRDRVPEALLRIIGKAMAPKPSDRYRNAEEMLADLKRMEGREGKLRYIRTMRCVSISVGLILTAVFLSVTALGWKKMKEEQLEQMSKATVQESTAALADTDADEETAFDEAEVKRVESLLDDARDYVSQGRFAEAEACCQELLQEKAAGQLSVYLEVADVYRAMNQYSAARQILYLALEKGFSDYRIAGTMAIVVCEEQEQLPVENRSYEEVQTWYNQAAAQFKASGEKDSQLMAVLEDIMTQLYDGGWLSRQP